MTYCNPAAYDRFMGRWSDRLAPSFLHFAGVRDGQRVLDLGCGTGSLSRALVSFGATIRVTGVDPAAEYVSFARQAVPHTRAKFEVGSAEALAFPADTFDTALSLLVLQEFDDAGQAVREMARVTRNGGVVAACQWDFQHGMPMFSVFWEAAEAVAMEAVARRRQERVRPHPATIDELRVLWEACGLAHVTTATLELPMEFESFDDYWQPFLGGSTPTSRFAARLDGETGGALARALRNRLAPFERAGSFVLPARAWAVKGAKAIGARSRPPPYPTACTNHSAGTS
jgi:ubiquinone/menaquinone biosynthesis C-methylase UbiE